MRPFIVDWACVRDAQAEMGVQASNKVSLPEFRTAWQKLRGQPQSHSDFAFLAPCGGIVQFYEDYLCSSDDIVTYLTGESS